MSKAIQFLAGACVAVLIGYLIAFYAIGWLVLVADRLTV
jgi:hypothetical protein